MNEPPAAPNPEDSKKYFAGLVLEHLGVPRPFRTKHLGELEEILLPRFTQMSRHAWNATAPITTRDDPSIAYFAVRSPNANHESEIRRLNEIQQGGE